MSEFKLGISDHDSTPTIPINDVQKQSAKDLARELELARTQGYIEANVILKLLDLARDLLPMIPGLK